MIWINDVSCRLDNAFSKSHAITSGYFNSHERLIIICANSIKNILLINSNPENRDQRISWNFFYFLERNECKSDNAFKTSKPLSCIIQDDAPHEKKPKKEGEKSGGPLTPSPLIPLFSIYISIKKTYWFE